LEAKNIKVNCSFEIFLDDIQKKLRLILSFKKQWSREAGSDGAKYIGLKTSYINEVLEKARGEAEE